MKHARFAELEAQRDAAMIKIERCLGELERLGAQRIQEMADVAADFDMQQLKSVVYDLEEAQLSFLKAEKELKRIQ